MKAKAEKTFLYGRFTRSSTPPKVIKFLIKNHIVKDEKQAQMLLLGLVVLLIVISVFLISTAFSEPTIKTLPIK